ncbi:flagellar basal body-associated FliL family protein [Clostridium weizhouense]|uniref:Flagellar protein FliL n=1 Tax=Clostridium weizhouense TaxID=2859781 RepID=A0ABS7ARK9_9CLOT|nr:flagellar basal body-associated FliL family protein [Clostridium weizhouense]MBW6411291.1 flagellar basal body-associated FliL family protein [Clostridium weizhouense]
MLKKKFIIILCVLALFLLPSSIILGYQYFSNNISINTQKTDIEKIYVNLGQIIVNLSPPDSQRHFKAEIALGYNKDDYNNKKQLTKEKHLPIIKDVVNFYFKSKSLEFISDSTNENQIKKELMECINQELPDYEVTDIRFSKFIIQ